MSEPAELDEPKQKTTQGGPLESVSGRCRVCDVILFWLRRSAILSSIRYGLYSTSRSVSCWTGQKSKKVCKMLAKYTDRIERVSGVGINFSWEHAVCGERHEAVGHRCHLPDVQHKTLHVSKVGKGIPRKVLPAQDPQGRNARRLPDELSRLWHHICAACYDWWKACSSHHRR